MRIGIGRARDIACVVVFAVAVPAAARSQTVVRVQLAEPTGVPVVGADVAVLRGLTHVVGHAVSDSLGRARFAFDGSKGEYQIRARKIGYSSGDRVFALDRSADTSSYRVFMEHAPATLDSVRVTARSDPRHRDFYLDADSIAASPRPLESAWDILTKLRPDMLQGRANCGGVQEVWVNDQRVRDFVIPSPQADARRNVGVPSGARYSYRAFAILSEIDPLHIAKLVYHDCDDFSVNANHAQNAVFITLKQGVDYVPGEGSFVLNLPPRRHARQPHDTTGSTTP